jgi:hypothetical protein
LGWPPPQVINHRRYRDAEAYERFRGKLAREAIAKRASLLKQPKEDAATA